MAARGSIMVNQDDVKRIALSLPEVSQKPGEFSFVVDGKLFAWVYPERIDPKKPRVPNKHAIAVMVAGEGEKQIMLAAAPDKFFTTSHYDGVYPERSRRAPFSSGFPRSKRMSSKICSPMPGGAGLRPAWSRRLTWKTAPDR